MQRLLMDARLILEAGPAVVRRAASMCTSMTTAVTSVATAATCVAAKATATRYGLSVAETVRREAGPASRALLDLRPDRARRRVWAGHGHAQIEVRGMTGSGPKHQRVSAAVTDRLRRLRGGR